MKKFIKCMAALIACIQLVTIPAYALGGEDYTPSYWGTLINQVQFAQIAPGVTEQQLTLLNGSGGRVENFIMEIDLQGTSSVDIVTASYEDSSGYGMSSVRDMAAAAEANGKHVVAAINADYYDMSTGVPLGCFVKDGVEYKSLPDSWFFFGITKDGSAVLGNAGKYKEVKDNLQEALGGQSIIVRDGSPIHVNDQTLMPRCAAGIKADGSVIFMVSDGRQAPYSTGLTLSELADLMAGLGCVDAINLDGGGSATYLSREQGSSELACKNSPSDGNERPVANGFLVVSTAEEDGEFSYASVTPADQTYTPGTEVQMTAEGLDAGGGPAALPEQGLTWKLADESFGTVDETGKVVSSGKEGETEVQLWQGDRMVGSTNIEFANPDTLYFQSSEVSLPFDSDSDLGLCAQYQLRSVILGDGDIAWSIPEGMGTMNGNVLHTSPSGSVSGVITATYVATGLTASLDAQVGQLPVVIYDFEDGLSGWSAGNAGRGEVTSVETVDYASGEPVRFGDQSLKLNFDLTNAQKNVTLGAYAGPAESVNIPGSPKAIGAWIYADEEAQGFWLRCYVYDATGQYKPINFTTESEGINWTGWKYCEASLEGIQGPYTTFPNQMFRMMSLKSGVKGPMTKGSIYIDNVRVVYGASVDDMHPPIIGDISVDGNTYHTSQVSISTSFSEDTSDEYATGMDYTKISIYVDGINYKDVEGVYALNKGQNKVSLEHLSFPDGEHRVDVVVRDNFGNETTKTAYFTVDTGAGTTVSLNRSSDTAPLGGSFPLTLTANEAENIQSVSTTLKVGKDFPVSSVTFGAGFTGTYDYNASKGLLTLDIQSDGTAQGSASLAEIAVSVPATVQEGAELTYNVTKSAVSYQKDMGEHFFGSFMVQPQSIPVTAPYQVEVLSRVVGQDFSVKVTGQDGEAVEGAQVIRRTDSGTEVLGVTDAQGRISVSTVTDSVQSYEIYALKDNGYSFIVKGQSLPALGTAEPFNILANAVENSSTSKNISWMTNPLTSGSEPVLQTAVKSDYEAQGEAAFTSFAGTAGEYTFTGETDIAANGIVRLNSAVASGLTAGETYVYRVGDGTIWSETREFTLPAAGQTSTNFFILGDTQTANTTNLVSVLNALASGSTAYDFGIHVGDMIDDAGRFNQLNAISSAFTSSALNSVDMVRVFGNHEYMGDADASVAKAYYNPPQNGPDVNKGAVYSVEYNNIYIANMGFCSDRATLEAQMEWLREDAAKSDAAWKILVTHQPPYYTNPDGGNGLINELLPSAVDAAGIDFVFSGHDHAYGRTVPLKDGQPNENGTTYFVCGSTGEKYYEAVNDGNFEVFNDEQKPCYLTVSATSGSFTVTALRPDGTVLDTYTKTKTVLEASVSTESARVNEAFEVSVTTSGDVQNVKLFNTNGMNIGLRGKTVTENADGTRTFTLTAALGTVGSGRVLQVVTQDASGAYSDSGVTVSVDIVSAPPAISSFTMPETAVAGRAFAITAVTDESASSIAVYNEFGLKMGLSGLSYEIVDGQKVWTAVMKIGTKGSRTFTASAVNRYGVRSEETRNASISVSYFAA